jgi:hypothetical protein
MTPMTDLQLRNKGFHILLKELGTVDTIRFLAQVSAEKRDYILFQDEMFQDMTVDELYEKAKRYQEQKSLND